MGQTINNAWMRIEAILARVNMTTNYFSRYIGLARGENLYQIKRGNNGISMGLADRIVRHFPEYNRMWLLTGEGAMLCEEERTQGGGIPLYRTDLERELGNYEQLQPSMNLLLPSEVEADLAMVYHGRAMSPLTAVGTVLLLKKIDPASVIPGKEYAIVSKNYITLRIVRMTEQADEWRLVATDTEQFDDMRLPVADIEAVYAVCAKLIMNI